MAADLREIVSANFKTSPKYFNLPHHSNKEFPLMIFLIPFSLYSLFSTMTRA